MTQAEIKELGYPCYDAFELDLTEGCDVDCIYCALSDQELLQLLDVENILSGPLPSRGVYLSPNSDPFSKITRESTHKVLEWLLSGDVPVTLITKQQIPEQTIELLAQHPNLVIPVVSLARLDQSLNDYVEPGAATAKERLDTMKALSDSGLKVMARLNPLYPVVDDTDEKLEAIIDAYSQAGVHCVKTAYVVVRDSRLTQGIIRKMTEHPQLRESWNAMSETIRIHQGKGNVPPYDGRVELYRKVNALCEEYNLRFAVCSVLDSPILGAKPKGVPVCSDIRTFYGGIISAASSTFS